LGVFCAHHYRYAGDRSTFLVEVDEATYQRAGFETMPEAASLRLCEQVFAPDLQGHPLLSNRSTWRRFPVIWNERFHDGRTVLVGDALRTVHFSIGSGTRLAMEDAIALAHALREVPSIDDALAMFQRERLPPMKKIWDAANVSLRWYEGMGSMMAVDPHEFAYRYMTRSGRVDHAEMRRRDPQLAQAYERLHPELFN
jgi:2-polyprenyl-6-methoxyphenol hydroxylase-like FAD-dependent oxidoreductase